MDTKMNIKLNLTQLKCAKMKSEKTGGTLLVIPVLENDLYESEVGNIYLDLIAWPLKTTQKDQTHLVKQSLPKATREKMSKEEMQAMPILGNLKVWEDAAGTHTEPAPNVTSTDVAAGVGDLPF